MSPCLVSQIRSGTGAGTAGLRLGPARAAMMAFGTKLPVKIMIIMIFKSPLCHSERDSESGWHNCKSDHCNFVYDS